MNHLGLVCTKKGEYDQAEEYFSESMTIKRDLEDQRGLVSVLINFAELHLVQQHWEEMRTLCNDAIEIIGDQPFHEPQAIATFLIGLWHFESGDINLGVKHFALAIAIAWNFNASLGQRINRSIARNLNVMHQLGKTRDTSGLVELILDSARRMIKDDNSAALDNLRNLMLAEQR